MHGYGWDMPMWGMGWMWLWWAMVVAGVIALALWLAGTYRHMPPARRAAERAEMKRKITRMVASMASIAAAITVAASFAAPKVSTEAPAFSVVRSSVKSLPAARLAGAHKTMTRGKISPDRKTITFTGRAIRLVATTGPENDMLSYRIAGLRNPTLVVPAGSTLKVLFVNSDEDMTHNLRFTALRPPFDVQVKEAETVGSHTLPHRAEGVYRVEDMTVRIPAKSGAYTYLCTVAGHAKGGMYGTLTVR